ncbi:MAG: glycoside hydrolase family 2 protein [Oscillospiraceae bacterium]|nr:glycoside hydrolase family 2 protein [Oscillospiraceae bacterium]
MIRINNDWEFIREWNDDFPDGKGEAETVRLPHTVKEMPLHYGDPSDYEMVCGYRVRLDIHEKLKWKRLFLQFDGAAHIAELYMNGMKTASHKCGYTSFRTEITDYVKYGEENIIAVKLDTTENPSVPPFGFVIDYLTYGGLYRDVWLDVRPSKIIEDIFVQTPTLNSAEISCRADMSEDSSLKFEIIDEQRGEVTASGTAYPGKTNITLSVPAAKPWTPDSPVVYRCRVTLKEDGQDGDVQEVTFGFRTAEFRNDGFYLNGEKIFLRGVNRHQSFPYVGYAVPEQLQREDARIIKHELQCNTVRTSHYPQSHYFIDECDRQGLLVFTELPGWQHIGDQDWKDQACENVREMVMQYRNHPSIILWGVRINESQDDDQFYTRTNAIAHDLDPSRATTGVRYLEKSSLLEDVYAFNDFSHTGDNEGARLKKDVSPDQEKPLLISECNGHMYPTKSFDPWQNRQEHALRHARVLDAAMSDGGHVGFYSWCMFDYPTHKDFGSGDRICYHGVMDAFRNPKLAAAFYASQGEEKPVLEIGSPMDIGDYPGGQLGSVYVFTNADEVELYKNGDYVTTFRPQGWKALKHGPVLIDDTIGKLLETNEGFSKSKANMLRKCLISAGKHGLTGMPLKDKLLMGFCMMRYGMSFKDGYDLYGKYVGNWGGESTVWRFDAVRKGETVASVTKCPSAKLHLELTPSHTELTEGDVYDMAAVRIRILDEHGAPAPYAQIPVILSVTGDIELVGPSAVTLEGGSCGTYIRTTEKEGKGTLTAITSQTESAAVNFKIKKG